MRRREREKASICWPFRVLVRKGGFEPPRSCERQPLKLERVKAERCRPRRIGVGCSASLPIKAVQGRRTSFGLQILANGVLTLTCSFTREQPRAPRGANRNRGQRS